MVVIITGASAGIGRALAQKLAQQGAKLVLSARRVEKLDELNRELGGSHLTLRADVSNHDDCQNLVEQTLTRFGRIDTLVCNAGYGIARGVADSTHEDVARMFATNVYGTLDPIRAAVPIMRKQEPRDGYRGQIMIVSSAAARRGLPFFGIYSATKAAQLSIAEALRVELKPDQVAVTSVHPIGDPNRILHRRARPRRLEDARARHWRSSPIRRHRGAQDGAGHRAAEAGALAHAAGALGRFHRHAHAVAGGPRHGQVPRRFSKTPGMNRMPSLEDMLKQAGADIAAGNFSRAEWTLRKLYARHPTSAPVLDLLAAWAMRQGRLDEAISWARRAVGAEPANPDLHFNLALMLAASGQNAEAIRSYQQAIRLGPDRLGAPQQPGESPAPGRPADRGRRVLRPRLEHQSNLRALAQQSGAGSAGTWANR
jgi:NAD(P)-dependent dehydrogenase (short-subunit alcohol dehydrogenase family)